MVVPAVSLLVHVDSCTQEDVQMHKQSYHCSLMLVNHDFTASHMLAGQKPQDQMYLSFCSAIMCILLASSLTYLVACVQASYRCC